MPSAANQDLRHSTCGNLTGLLTAGCSQLPHTMAPAAAALIDWKYLGFLFTNISPYFWSSIGIALCVGLSILGAAW